MRLAQRVTDLKPSATLAVGATAAKLRSEGVEVVSFAAGEPDFDTPEPIKQACIEGLRAGRTRYSPVPGDAASREVIARKLREENGIAGVTADHVVISAGGKQSLHHLMHVLFDPRDETPGEVVLPEPAWVSYRPIAEMAGARVVSVPTTADEGFRPTAAGIRAALTERSRLLVLNSPSNPCGTMIPEKDLREIAEVVANHPDLLVLSDEIYDRLVFGDVPHFSIGSIAKIAERVITINGLSKAFAMTGWRIGYLAGVGDTGAQIAAAAKKLQSQSTTAIPGFFFPAIVAAYEQCAEDVERMRRAYASRAELMHGRLSAMQGVNCPKASGAFYCFPDFSAFAGKAAPNGTVIEDGISFASALLECQHVACVPGPPFGAGGEHCCRFTFACGDAQITRGMDKLEEFLGSLS